MHKHAQPPAETSGARVVTGRYALPLLLMLTAIVLLFVACKASTDATATAGPSTIPTGTRTPAGDILRIDGAAIRHVFIPVSDIGPMYALTESEFFASTGVNWQPRSTDLLQRHYLIDPQDPERILRGDHQTCGLREDAKVIPLQISDDEGMTWETLENGANIRPLAFDPTDRDVIYGSDCGLVFSIDGGATWETLNALPGYRVADVVVANTRLLVLGISPAGDLMVRAIDISTPDNPVIGAILLHADGPGCLDAFKERIIVGTAAGVLLSDDGGITWASSRTGLEPVTSEGDTDTSRIGQVARAADLGIQAIRIDQRNPKRVFAGTAHGLFVSQTDGATWVRYSEIPAEANVIQIQFGLDAADLYITTTSGVIMVPTP